MTTSTQLRHFQPDSVFKQILIIAGIGIAALTLPTFGSDDQNEINSPSTPAANLVNHNTSTPKEATKALNYHNFLASYFLQEASIDRGSLKPEDTGYPVMTLAKLPFSVALNVWTNLKDQ